MSPTPVHESAPGADPGAAPAPAPGELPNLVVIGAMKCATTALHRYLDAHPEIAMAPAKELNFFVGDEAPAADGDWHSGNWHHGVDWYASHFAPAPVRGEASPAYSSPAHPEAAERMARVLPESRLVYMVRDPIERAISQYRHHLEEGTERRPLAAALLDSGSQYLSRSRYFARLKPFLERFPADRIHVCVQEDLLTRRRRTLSSLYAFAGVDPEFWSDALEQRWHVRQTVAPPLSAPLERRLTELLAGDVAALRAFCGRPLDAWRPY